MAEIHLEKDLPEQIRLARTNGIKDILIAVPQIRGNERMLLRRMCRVFYNPDPNQALQIWQELPPQTERQERALAIGVDTFYDIHQQTQRFLATEGSDSSLETLIRSYRGKDSPRGPGYRWNDQYQSSQKERRSLAQLQTSGVKLSIPPDKLYILKKYHETRPDIPILESSKNERIAVINGFRGALMTLVVHDPFDHFLTSTMLRELGLETEYRSFFDSVGRPFDTDLFSREGELVASPAYAYRLWTMVETGIQPTITAARTLRAIQKSLHLTPSQQEVSAYLQEQVIPFSDQARKYGYITTSVIIELLEQRRKQGFIRTLDDNNQITGSLSLLDPEYLSLIVRITRMLSDAELSTTSALMNINILIEEYFRYISSPDFIIGSTVNLPHNLRNRVTLEDSESLPTLALNIQGITDRSVASESSLPQSVQDWIVNNPGFTATQEPLKSP